MIILSSYVATIKNNTLTSERSHRKEHLVKLKRPLPQTPGRPSLTSHPSWNIDLLSWASERRRLDLALRSALPSPQCVLDRSRSPCGMAMGKLWRHLVATMPWRVSSCPFHWRRLYLDETEVFHLLFCIYLFLQGIEAAEIAMTWDDASRNKKNQA